MVEKAEDLSTPGEGKLAIYSKRSASECSSVGFRTSYLA